jgi:SET domain
LLSATVVQGSAVVKSLNTFLQSNPTLKEEISGGNKYPFAIDMVAMALFIVHERCAEDSYWKTYIESLPETYTLSISWGRDKVQHLLKGTALEFISLERISWAEKVVDIIAKSCSNHFKDGQWSYENFIWAFCAISSRAFPKATTASEISDWVTLHEICLYPVLDMLDHKRNHKIQWDMSKDGVAFMAGEEVGMGLEVFNNYGSKGNENLLNNYGFVLAYNPEDYYKIILNLRDVDPLIEAKRTLLAKQEKKSTTHLLFADGELSADILRTFD